LPVRRGKKNFSERKRSSCALRPAGQVARNCFCSNNIFV